MADPSELPRRQMSSLTLRLISATVLIPIVLAAAYLGFPWWDILVIVFGGVMAWEWSRIVARRRDSQGRSGANRLLATPAWPEAMIASVLVVLGLVDFSFSGQIGFPAFDLRIVLLIGIAVATLVAVPRHRSASLWFGLGFLYVAAPCAAIIALRADAEIGLAQILWVVAMVIAADTGAYAAGRSIGGPKLAPRISPNKTWAGLGGAIVCAAIAGVIAALLLEKPSIWPLAALSGVLAIVAQAGDLAESALKRRFGVKDSGHIIPGHGGALDRVDGFVAVAAVVATINYEIGSSVLTWL